jgi:hypothetical protein
MIGEHTPVPGNKERAKRVNEQKTLFSILHKKSGNLPLFKELLIRN